MAPRHLRLDTSPSAEGIIGGSRGYREYNAPRNRKWREAVGNNVNARLTPISSQLSNLGRVEVQLSHANANHEYLKIMSWQKYELRGMSLAAGRLAGSRSEMLDVVAFAGHTALAAAGQARRRIARGK